MSFSRQCGKSWTGTNVSTSTRRLAGRMADFRPAFENTLKWEDNPRSPGEVTFDSGGKTRFGIAAKFNQMPDNFWTDPVPEALNLAKALYQQKYWVYDGLISQNIANKVFDMAVNMGPKQAHKILQRSLQVQHADISIDGVYGPQTEQACNQADSMNLLVDLREHCSEFYVGLVQQKPEDQKYLHGWLRRAAS